MHSKISTAVDNIATLIVESAMEKGGLPNAFRTEELLKLAAQLTKSRVSLKTTGSASISQRTRMVQIEKRLAEIEASAETSVTPRVDDREAEEFGDDAGHMIGMIEAGYDPF